MQHSPVRFRRATTGDVASIVALVESAYRGEASRAGWTTEADFLDGQRTDAEEIAEVITSDDKRIVLATQDESLAGSVLLAREPDALHVGMFAVRPALQGHGLGRALLEEVERIATSEALASTLRMRVIGQRVELIAWYERRGFRRTGRHEPFPYGQPRYGLPRRPDLYMEVLEKTLGA
jgi:ribosomal protein S18 acetylase RimI-like enzyme